MTSLPSRTRLFDYEIERTLGTGGFGITYAARDRRTNRAVAVKEFFIRDNSYRIGETRVGFRDLPADLVSTLLATFADTTREAQDLHHPNLVATLDFIETNGTGYQVMELVDGVEFDDWQRSRGGFAATTAASLERTIGRVFDAVEYMHERELLHRDIKPGNVMVANDGRTVVIDLGIMKRIAFDGRLARRAALASGIVATDGFAPPEQMASGDILTTATDVFALGALVYAALTGRPPASTTARQTAVATRRADPLASLAELRPDLPPEIPRAVEEALSLAPARRIGTIAEFRQRLGWPAPRRDERTDPPKPRPLGDERGAATLAPGLAALAARQAAAGTGAQAPLIQPAAVAAPRPTAPPIVPPRSADPPQTVAPGLAALERRAASGGGPAAPGRPAAGAALPEASSGPKVQRALKPGTVVYDYQVDGVVEPNVLGLRYRARKLSTGVACELHEFFPLYGATRHTNGSVLVKDSSVEIARACIAVINRRVGELVRVPHFNVWPVIDYFQANNTGYVVSEPAEGPAVTDWLDARMAPPRQLVPLYAALGPVLHAVAHLHQHGLTHGNIIPGNVVMVDDRRPMLINMGLRLELQRLQWEAATAVQTAIDRIAPPPYRGVATPQMLDIYGCGLLLYLSLRGNGTRQQATSDIGDSTLPRTSLTVLRPDLPRTATEAIDRAIVFDPRGQIGSVVQLMRAIGWA